MSTDAEMVLLPTELCPSPYSQYSGYVTNVFYFIPFQDHICCYTAMPLRGNILPLILPGRAALFLHLIRMIWLGGWKVGFL